MDRHTLVASSLGLAVAVLCAPSLRAQSGERFHFTIGAGTVSSSASEGGVFGSVGGNVTGAASFALTPSLGIRAEGLWSAMPARAVGVTQRVVGSSWTCPVGVFCVAIYQMPSAPVRGGAGVAGADASLLLDLPPALGVRSYVVAGAGAFRDYTVPHASNGWRAGPVLTTGAEMLGYGVRFGGRSRYGVELQARRFDAGLARWLFPATLTFTP